MGSYAQLALKILIKNSNAVQYIESNIQNIEVSRKNDPII